MQDSKLYNPYCTALLVCEHVSIDSVGKASLTGIFDTLGAISTPVRHLKLFIFASLTDGRGEKSIIIRIKEFPSNLEILKNEFKVQFKDPRMYENIIFEVQDLIFKNFGTHIVEVEANGEVLMARRLLVANPNNTPSIRR